MSTNSRTLARTAAKAVPLAVLAGTALAGPALAATSATTSDAPTAKFKESGVGYSSVIADSKGKRWPAGTHILTVNGSSVAAYCADFDNFDVEKSGTYVAKTRAQVTKVKNVNKAADIARRHESIGKKLPDAKMEAAAAQTAIWYYTDSLKNWDKSGNATLTSRARELIKGAQSVNESPISYRLTADANVTGPKGDDAAKNTITAKLTDQSGKAAAGKNVKFVVDGKETTVKTDASGVATHTVDASVKEADGKEPAARAAKVTFAGTISAGTLFVPESGKQPMITKDAFGISRSASAVLPTYNAPAKEVEATPSPSETKKPEATPSETPVKPEAEPIEEETTEEPTEEETTPAEEGKKKAIDEPSDPKPTAESTKEPEPKVLPFTGGTATIGTLVLGAGAAAAGFFGWRRKGSRR